jgi:glycosyltransferase involved in cell wall biosynthesis
LNSLGLQDRFVLGYAGNMGRVHDIELLLTAANRLREAAPDVHLLFVGNGAKDPQVKAAAQQPGSNVTLVGPMDRDQQPVFLNACHVAVMALAPGMSGVGVPSRLYNILAAGRPVVAAVDADSEPSLVLREEEIGIQVPPGDAEAFVGAVLKMRSDPVYLRQAGERARRAAIRRFGFPNTLEAYRRLLGEWNWPGPLA